MLQCPTIPHAARYEAQRHLTYLPRTILRTAVLYLPLRPLLFLGPPASSALQLPNGNALLSTAPPLQSAPILPPCARRALKIQHVSAGDMLRASLSAYQSPSVFRAARSRHKGRQLWQHRTSWRGRPGGVAYHSSSLALDASEPESFEIPCGSAGIVTVECVSLSSFRCASASYLCFAVLLVSSQALGGRSLVSFPVRLFRGAIGISGVGLCLHRIVTPCLGHYQSHTTVNVLDYSRCTSPGLGSPARYASVLIYTNMRPDVIQADPPLVSFIAISSLIP